MMTNNSKWIWLIAALLGGLLLGYFIFGGNGPEDRDQETNTSASEPTIWTCSMHPQIRMNEPGNCPICGMELIPAESDNGNELTGFSMSEEAVKLANVQTCKVERGQSETRIELSGKIMPDERRVQSQTAHLNGRIEKLYVKFTGQHVSRGQQLADIYSAELVVAQQELFEAIKLKPTHPELYDAARRKLEQWNISKKEIDAIEASGEVKYTFPVTAERSGYVTAKNVNIGDYVSPGKVLFEIADLSRVWVVFDAYEEDLPWLKKGIQVTWSSATLPEETHNDAITYVDPVLSEKTRTAGVRVETNNPDGLLKPGVFVEGFASGSPGDADGVLMIPSSAVLWTGKRSVVYTTAPDASSPYFLFKEVKLGRKTGDMYVVLGGLHEGEKVVCNGVFTIDAAAQLAGKHSMMNPPAVEQPAQENLSPVEKVSLTKVEEAAIMQFFTQYFVLKDALVNSDPHTAAKEAGEMNTKSLPSIQSIPQWGNYAEKLSANLGHIHMHHDIATQRSYFDELSEVMIDLADLLDWKGEEIYVEFCPMANENAGAYWLSKESEIRNPYFGDAMLSCGSVKRTIK